MSGSRPSALPRLVPPRSAQLAFRMILPADAAFLLTLMTDPAYCRYIGDRGLKTVEDARRYIREHIATHHTRHGFGLWMASTHAGRPVGIAGLLQREQLDAPDIGYALLAEARGRGLGREAASAMVAHGFDALGAPHLHAVTHPDNLASNRLLAGLGFRLVEASFRMTPEAAPSLLHQLKRPAPHGNRP
ncbi:GNAT family N-acetyltransferase [Microvirga tunisiensis]|uniref:GNAT family N-acetyltransferase n=1 Tax=Pannonibacter tanglangensis TaxID=2750084 RepID=A0A7X5F5J3_9HYPH|nr:GNAT family N-acetyltransferase [Pannonibacter sp. XCT-53]NBN80167.1 GNAT family N-acetyltransferase [Pannonibacter sp. XCT-53]